MTDATIQHVPTWLTNAKARLQSIANQAYDNLDDDESMPHCFGAIVADDGDENGFNWALLRIPDDYDKYEAFEYFQQGLSSMRRNGEHHVLGGFMIQEGLELDKDNKTRTGREVLIITLESPEGWRAVTLYVIERINGDVSLKEELSTTEFHFPGETQGRMQGMFPEPELTIQ
jgi:hypothetical protein